MTRRPDRTRLFLQAVAVALLACLVGANILTQFRANEQADQKAQAQQQAAQNAQDAKDVADPLAELCRTDPSVAARVGDACRKAAEVQRDPSPVGKPVDVRGITSTSIEAGRLVVSYDDGTRRDVGEVVGQPGASGPIGPAGRGVVATVLDGVDLVVLFSDGQRENLGRIVGRDGDPGRGIASVDATDGRLIITYDDGTTQDAGELPRGPQGERGAPPASWTVQRADGSTERCTRNSGSPDDAPTYSCTASGGTAPPTETTTVTVTPEPTDKKPENGGLFPN